MGGEGTDSDISLSLFVLSLSLSLKVVTNIYRKHTRLWNLNRWLADDLTPQSKCGTTPDTLMTLTDCSRELLWTDTLTHVTRWCGQNPPFTGLSRTGSGS